MLKKCFATLTLATCLLADQAAAMDDTVVAPSPLKKKLRRISFSEDTQDFSHTTYRLSPVALEAITIKLLETEHDATDFLRNLVKERLQREGIAKTFRETSLVHQCTNLVAASWQTMFSETTFKTEEEIHSHLTDYVNNLRSIMWPS